MCRSFILSLAPRLPFKGVEVYINPIGCAIERLVVPDSKGRLADVVLGFDTKESYLVSHSLQSYLHC